uniref:Uncharacterized protein n=1 Tax=Timema bartmani TaxID=61472 RepID=A0A7R9F7L6_9NEOP|nr:unnamed protein product [Timema bartmani]
MEWLAHSIQFQEILNKKHKHNQDILTVIKNAHRTCSARFTCLEEEREGASADMASSEATTLAQLSSVSAAECFSGIEVQSYRVSRGPYRVNMGRLGLELSLKICIFHFKFVPPSFAHLSHATLERLKPLIYLLSHVKSSSIDGLNNPINNETQHHSSISYENELDSCPQIKQELSISKVALDLISVLCQEHNVSTSFLLYDCSKISQEHKGTRLLQTCYSAACHRDEQGYFGPVPALHVTERRGARLRRTCYSAACDRDEEQGSSGPVLALPVKESRETRSNAKRTGCECDIRGAVTKEQVVISQPIPRFKERMYAAVSYTGFKSELLNYKLYITYFPVSNTQQPPDDSHLLPPAIVAPGSLP